MYRNQYLITNAEGTRPCLIGADESRFGAWRVFCFPPLRRYLAQGANFEALLIGLAVDPLHPARDMQQVLDHLVDVPSLTPAAIAARVEHLTGRIVLLVRIGTETHVWDDSCLLRRLEPAAAEIPLNPHTLWFKKYVDGSATATFLSRRIKHLYADRSLT